MKHLKKIVVLAVTIILMGTTAFAEGKIDPLLMIMADNPDVALSKMNVFVAKSPEDIIMVDAIVKATEGQSNEAKTLIEKLGGTVRTVIGDIMTASIPLDVIVILDDSNLIEEVEAAKPISSKMNYARTSSGVNQVQEGTCSGCSISTSINAGYTGTNVIVGVVDSGIDCQNTDFKNSTGSTRIVAYWDQSTSGSGVSEISGSTGKEYTGTALTDGSCNSSPDTSGHGTHVTGIAAGSNATYTGVASNASIISVKSSSTDAQSSAGTFSTSVIDGVNYIFKKADTLNKAAVVNLSLGTSLGAHDGTSLLEQGLDALLVSGSAEKKGRAIVNAAGNENFMTSESASTTYGGIHATVNVAAGAPKGYEIAVRDSSTVVNSGGLIVDIWLDSGTTCQVGIDAYSAATGALATSTGWVTYGDATKTVDDGSVSISLNYSETVSSTGKKHGSATINRASSSVNANILANYYFYLAFTGACTGNAWLYPDQTDYADFTKQQQTTPAPTSYTYVIGDSNLTITIPGTASKVITAASYIDRATWVGGSNTTYNQTAAVGTSCGSMGGTEFNISLFSSLGPTANSSDLQKPDIASPGEPIISTLSSGISSAPDACTKPDSTHYKMQGTSMAAPHVTGAVALMFQKNNCLTPSDAKSYIRASATADSSTGSSLPNYTWGYGKLNAAAVMSRFNADASCYDKTPSPTPTPSGSTSCSLISAKNNGELSAWAFAVCLAIYCCALGLLRKMHVQWKNI